MPSPVLQRHHAGRSAVAVQMRRRPKEATAGATAGCGAAWDVQRKTGTGPGINISEKVSGARGKAGQGRR